jgi:hypothetical protein
VKQVCKRKRIATIFWQQHLEVGLGVGDVIPQDGHGEELLVPLLLIPIHTHRFYVQTKYNVTEDRLRLTGSVADPDPYVFGLPGSESFYPQAKVVRKTLIPTVL